MSIEMSADPRRRAARWTHHGADQLTAWRMKGSCARMLTARAFCPRHHRYCNTPTFYSA
ncbi:hypothetical protein LX16_4801 [Stackebrandtia albiflava]|uniref:Uncharacterized protein n=1 Tax=Stackebrandtia albiflava TaxID=406432 RepID=A0A562UR03_9ACTN|nr:hypothetical protein [Stackebrandtia albiflava]TWJ08018.1 hypothetical protein LX16_4801 [Stackebrandtia albiflava]